MGRPGHGSRLTAAAVLLLMLAGAPPWLPVPGTASGSPDPANEDVNQGGSGYSHFGSDWYVDGGDDLRYANQTIEVEGNITINATGRLVLENVTLRLASTNTSTYFLEVLDGAELQVLDGCNLTLTNASCRWWGVARAGSTLVLRNSTLAHCGVAAPYLGFRIVPDGTYVQGCTFYNGTGGLDVLGRNFTIADSTFSDCSGAGLILRAADGYRVDNTTFGSSPGATGVQADNCNGTLEGCRFNSLGVGLDSSYGNVHDNGSRYRACSAYGADIDNAPSFVLSHLDLAAPGNAMAVRVTSGGGNISGCYIDGAASWTQLVYLDSCDNVTVRDTHLETRASRTGVELVSCSAVRVTNTSFGDATNSRAVRVLDCCNITVDNNTVRADLSGLMILDSTGVRVADNDMNCSYSCLWFRSSPYCTVRRNVLDTTDGISFPLYFENYNKMRYLLHDIDDSNTCQGKTVRYIRDQDGFSIPKGDAMSVLVNCHNATLSSHQLQAGHHGIFMGYCSNSALNGVTFTLGSRLYANRCWDLNVSNSAFWAPTFWAPLELHASKDCTLYFNNISKTLFNVKDGVVRGCTGNYMRLSIYGRGVSVIGSSFTYKGIGIFSDNVVIDGCDFNATLGTAIRVTRNDAVIRDCTFTNNSRIYFSPGNGTRVFDCVFDNNYNGDIYLGGSGNRIYHNNFHNTSADPVQGTQGNNMLESVMGEGNYWDDYTGLDDGSDGRYAGDGIGDTLIPHHLDRSPMMRAWGWYLPDAPSLNKICPDQGYNATGAYNVSWQAAADADTYRLKEYDSGDLATVTGSFLTTQRSVNLTGKVNDTYHYRVRGINGWGLGPWSDARFVEVDMPPLAPAGLVAEPRPEGNAIDVGWEAVTGEVASYELWVRGGDGADWARVDTFDHPDNSTTHNGLVDGRNHTYRVRSLDARGQHSAWSAPVLAVPSDVVAPLMPVGLTVAEVEDDRVMLIWTPNREADLAGYLIYRAGSQEGLLDAEPLNPDSPADAPLFYDEDVSGGETYFYAISAVDEVPNESMMSHVVKATVPLGNRPPEVANVQYDVEMPEDSMDDSSIDLSRWFRDPDGDHLTFGVSGDGNISVTIFQSTGQVTLEPLPDWNGVERLTFSASDGYAKVSDNVTVTVTFVNDPPKKAFILRPAQGAKVKGNAPVNLSGYAEDIDLEYGDELSYSWRSNVSGPLGLGKNLSVPKLKVGAHTIVLTVSDRAGASVNDSITITVEPVVEPPPPDGEDGANGEDGQDGKDGADGEDGTDGDGEVPDDGGGDDEAGASAVTLGLIMAALLGVVAAVAAVLLLRRQRQLEHMKEEERDEEEKERLEGSIISSDPVPRPRPKKPPEVLEGEWEIPVEAGRTPEANREDIARDPFSRKRADVYEVDLEEGGKGEF